VTKYLGAHFASFSSVAVFPRRPLTLGWALTNAAFQHPPRLTGATPGLCETHGSSVKLPSHRADLPKEVVHHIGESIPQIPSRGCHSSPSKGPCFLAWLPTMLWLPVPCRLDRSSSHPHSQLGKPEITQSPVRSRREGRLQCVDRLGMPCCARLSVSSASQYSARHQCAPLSYSSLPPEIPRDDDGVDTISL
jgi:hypothetical protein